MSIFSAPKHVAAKIVDRISPSCGKNLRSVVNQPAHNEAVIHRLDELEHQVHELRSVVETLNRDLDESRRLNLRATELMDVAFNELGK